MKLTESALKLVRLWEFETDVATMPESEICDKYMEWLENQYSRILSYRSQAFTY